MHSLHKRISKLIDNTFKACPTIKIVKDPDCNWNDEKELQRIPLFCSNDKSRYTRYCCVDLLILKNGKVRGIIEIEESNIKPTQVCGKFLTSAMSKCYIHKNDGGVVDIAESAFFIHVLDSSKLRGKSVKSKQFDNLEKSIKGIIPLNGSRIKNYRLLYIKHGDSFNKMVDFIKAELKD